MLAVMSRKPVLIAKVNFLLIEADVPASRHGQIMEWMVELGVAKATRCVDELSGNSVMRLSTCDYSHFILHSVLIFTTGVSSGWRRL